MNSHNNNGLKPLMSYFVSLLVYSLRLELGEEISEVVCVGKAVLSAGVVLRLVVDVVPDNAVAHACRARGANGEDEPLVESPLEEPQRLPPLRVVGKVRHPRKALASVGPARVGMLLSLNAFPDAVLDRDGWGARGKAGQGRHSD